MLTRNRKFLQKIETLYIWYSNSIGWVGILPVMANWYRNLHSAHKSEKTAYDITLYIWCPFVCLWNYKTPKVLKFDTISIITFVCLWNYKTPKDVECIPDIKVAFVCLWNYKTPKADPTNDISGDHLYAYGITRLRRGLKN